MLRSKYIAKKALHNTEHSQIYLALDDEKNEVIIKVVGSKITKEAFLEEHAIHKKLTGLRVPHVVPLISAGLFSSPLFLAMEYMPNDSLRHFIGKKIPLELAQRLTIMQGITKGLQGIHEAKIVHRDIKSPNIFLDRNLKAYIGDFGLSRFYNKSKGYLSLQPHVTSGTLAWTDPSMYVQPFKLYTSQTDTYSMGIVFWEILTYRYPKEFFSKSTVSDAENVKLVNQGVLQQALSKEYPLTMARLINACCSENPEKRPSIKQIEEVLESVQQSLSLPIDDSLTKEVQTVETSITPTAERYPITSLLKGLSLYGSKKLEEASGALEEKGPATKETLSLSEGVPLRETSPKKSPKRASSLVEGSVFNPPPQVTLPLPVPTQPGVINLLTASPSGL